MKGCKVLLCWFEELGSSQINHSTGLATKIMLTVKPVIAFLEHDDLDYSKLKIHWNLVNFLTFNVDF